jgi:lipopolysaccharide/colanic/teichoic acid biosynthesis glycosyltransferase
MIKHQVRPGITGWAQVNGLRGDTSIEKRIEHDLYYIENWTFAFDLRIVFLTVFKGFVNKNAY